MVRPERVGRDENDFPMALSLCVKDRIVPKREHAFIPKRREDQSARCARGGKSSSSREKFTVLASSWGGRRSRFLKNVFRLPLRSRLIMNSAAWGYRAKDSLNFSKFLSRMIPIPNAKADSGGSRRSKRYSLRGGEKRISISAGPVSSFFLMSKGFSPDPKSDRGVALRRLKKG